MTKKNEVLKKKLYRQLRHDYTVKFEVHGRTGHEDPEVK
jgi:hypothetical protein